MLDSYAKTDRLNVPPPVFRGCSFQELIGIGVVALLILGPVLVIFAVISGLYTLSIGMLGLGLVVGVIGGATLYQRMKRGKPQGYYPLLVRLWMQKRGFKQYGIITRAGNWDLGRTGRR